MQNLQINGMMNKNVNKMLLSTIFSGILLLQGLFLFAQSGRITCNLEDVTIEEVLKTIQEQTGYNYLISHEEIPLGTRTSVRVENASLEKALETCLEGFPLTYEIKHEVIILMPEKEVSIQPSGNPDRPTQTIRGRIIDKDSKTTLPGANIIVLTTDPVIGATSDEEGMFRLEKVPVGRHTLRVSYVGYEDLILPEIVVGSAKEVILSLALTEKPEGIAEVEIRSYAKGSPKNDMATVSARSFSVEESRRYAGSAGDPGRMALSFAGVNTDDDASNQIVVRGNSPNAMLWRLEGVQIPIPNHFAMEGWDAGYVSLLNTKMLGQSDFFTGAFPAEYGNGTSGVFDLTFRNGNNEKSENTFEFGVLGLDLTTEGPFSSNYKGSYLVNFRYATFSIMNLMGIRIGGDLLPEYTDLSYKFNLPAGKAGTFSVWGLGGKAYVEDAAVQDTTQWDEFEFLKYGYKTRTNMGATGITHTWFPGNRSYFKTVISFSGNSSTDKSYKLDSSYHSFPTYYEKLASSAVRASTLYNRKFSTKLSLRIGLVFSKLYYNYYSRYIDEDEDPEEWIEDIDGKGNTETFQAYIQTRFRPFRNLSVNLGVHSLLLTLNNDYSIEPRAGFIWHLPDNQSINGGIGLHSRHEYLMHYFYKETDENGNVTYPNKDLGLEKSFHYVLGYSRMFKEDMKFQVEVYYQDLWDLPVDKDPTKTWSPINDDVFGFDWVNEGKGRNYGIELTLEKYFTNDYYFLVTHSLFSARYKPLDGHWYNSRYSNNYITNLVGGKEFRIRDKNILGINGRFIWSGGRRDTPIDKSKIGVEEFDVSDHSRRNAIQYPCYLRLDAGVSYKINNPKVSHELVVDIQNVFNRENMGGSYYNSDTGEVIEYTLQGILPVVSYRLYF